MKKQFQKGDVIAIVETRVTQYVIGSGRPSETSINIRIVRVESASRDGVTIKSYRGYPGSPIYKYDNPYNRTKLMSIKDKGMQPAAKRLFNAATYFLDFDTQEKAQSAVLFA